MLNEEYTRLAKSLDSISDDQCKDVIGVALDRLRSDVGAMVVDLWVRTPGREGIDVLSLYLARNDAMRPPPMLIALTSNATGLLVWVAENVKSVWIDDIDEMMKTNKSVQNRCDGSLIEGRFVNLYDRTRGFAAVPVMFRSELRGILTVETDQPRLIGDHHLHLMRALAEPTGIILWKADSFRERQSQINEAITTFKDATGKSSQPLDPYRTGFIARPFRPDFDHIEVEIRAAFENERVQARAYVHRPGAGLVVEEMMRRISSAHFGLADITNMNSNVLIELGAMIASGKPFLIIQDMRERDAAAPFDIAGFQVYRYEISNGEIMISDPGSRQCLSEFVQKFIAEQARTNSDFRAAKEWVRA
jgi:hypothetical protein